ncbi:MAG: hypothetical protein ACRDI2_23245 [Chloroflexota bacterium]
MPWTCRLLTSKQFNAKDYPLRPGDLWFRCEPDVWRARVVQWRQEGAHRSDSLVLGLSDQYLAGTIDRRPPLLVVLPNRDIFSIDSCISGATRGWEVSGDPPRITISPSINCVGRYHGWLRNGILSDDAEGRTFPPPQEAA